VEVKTRSHGTGRCSDDGGDTGIRGHPPAGGEKQKKVKRSGQLGRDDPVAQFDTIATSPNGSWPRPRKRQDKADRRCLRPRGRVSEGRDQHTNSVFIISDHRDVK